MRSDATRCDAKRCEAMRSAGLEDSLKGQDWHPSSYKVLHVVLCLKGLRYPVVSQGIRSQQPVAKNEICHHKPPPQCAIPKGPVRAQCKSMQILSALPASVQRRQSWSRQVVLHLSFLCREPQTRIKVKRSWAKHRKTLRDNAWQCVTVEGMTSEFKRKFLLGREWLWKS